MLYSYSLAINLDKEYSWKLYKCIEDIIDYLEILTSLSKIVNKYEKKLESNITIEKNISNIIIE